MASLPIGIRGTAGTRTSKDVALPILMIGLSLCLATLPRRSEGGTALTNRRVEACRSQALGGAGVALEYDPSLIWINPGSPAKMRERAVSLSGHSVFPLGAAGSGIAAQPLLGGVIEAGFIYYDAGKVKVTASNGESRRIDANRDLLLLAGFSSPLTSRVSSGFSVRYLRSELAEEYTGTAVLADWGTQVKVSEHLKTGVAVRNLGAGIRYYKDVIALPVTVSAGIVAALPVAKVLPGSWLSGNLLIGLTDLDYRVADKAATLRGGIEYWWHRTVALRVGSVVSQDERLEWLSTGIGFAMSRKSGDRMIRYRFDYAVRLLSCGFKPTQTFSVMVLF